MRPKDVLVKADEILLEYVQPNSMIDMGNLFYAANEYRHAYRQASEIQTPLLAASIEFQKWFRTFVGADAYAECLSAREVTDFLDAINKARGNETL